MEQETEDDIRHAVAILRSGGVIIYPTDTVWGIGCDATNSAAIKRIYEIKRRDDAKSMITLVESVAALERTVEEVPEVGYQLLEASDSPLTIVYDRGTGVAPELLAEDGSLAVRVTSEAFSSELCRRLRRPIVSTSANISGDPTPLCFAQINPELLSAVDYVCESRRDEAPATKASTVIKLSAGGLFKILRK